MEATEYKRQVVTIKPHEIAKINLIAAKRPELRELHLSELVHIALREWFAKNL